MITNFNRLSIASGLKCEECDTLKRVYLDSKYLSNILILPEDKAFITQILEDLEKHIREKHPERAKVYLRD